MRLRDLSVGKKVALLTMLSVVGAFMIIPVSLTSLKQRMLEDRRTKISSLVEIAHGIVAHHFDLEKNGQLSREQAQAAAMNALEKLRYEGDGYFFINGLNFKVIMLPTNKKLVGQDMSEFKTKYGESLFQNVVALIRARGEGFHSYVWPKPNSGSEEAVEKISYVKGFLPWEWYIGTGMYADDIEQSYRRAAFALSVLVGVLSLSMLAIGGALGRAIAKPIEIVTGTMLEAAAGRFDTKIPFLGRRDEVGSLAKAMQTFRDTVTAARQEERLAEQARQLSRRSNVDAIIAQFDEASGAALASVSEAAQDLSTTANNMTSIASVINEQAEGAAMKAEQAASNVRSSAVGTHQLSASNLLVTEHMRKSSEVAERASLDEAGAKCTAEGCVFDNAEGCA